MKLFVVRAAAIAAFGLTGPGGASSQETPFSAIRELGVPSAPGAREPGLFATSDGRVLLSWTEPMGQGFAVRLAIGDETGWSEPRTVAEGDDLFVNWADFSSVAAFPDGTLAAHWLQANGQNSYTYDVNIALSTDDGRSWSEPLVPHRDRTQRQHGFVSLLPVAPDRLLAIWLDGRDYAASGGFAAATEAASDAMALRSATIASDGAMSDETVLDARTCSCCQTSAAITAGGTVVVAYRDRTAAEIRDVSIVRLMDGTWTEPTTVNDDGWWIEGCPVNGPAVDAAGERVAVAWFSVAADIPKVSVAFSDDEGASFGDPVRVDQGYPAGRVDLVLLPDGSALVSWLELTRRGEELRLCRVTPDVPCDQPMILAVSSRGRTSGFPKLALSGEHLYVAWTQPSEEGTSSPDLDVSVRTVVAKLSPRP